MAGELTLVLDEKDYRKLQSMISNLSKVEQSTAINNALRAGMGIIIAQGKSNLASTDLGTGQGKLKKSFGQKLDRRKKVSYGGFRRPDGAAAHLVSRGTTARYTRDGYFRGTVQKRGPYTGSHFWDDAVEQKGPEAMDRLMDTIYSEIDRIMR